MGLAINTFCPITPPQRDMEFLLKTCWSIEPCRQGKQQYSGSLLTDCTAVFAVYTAKAVQRDEVKRNRGVAWRYRSAASFLLHNKNIILMSQTIFQGCFSQLILKQSGEVIEAGETAFGGDFGNCLLRSGQ